MGYHTDFKLSQTRVIIDQDELIDTLNELTDYEWEDDLTIGGKWYDWSEHMVVLSLKYPNTAFMLEGDGEEQGDVWRAFYLAGKSHVVRPQIVWPAMDDSKLE